MNRPKAGKKLHRLSYAAGRSECWESERLVFQLRRNSPDLSQHADSGQRSADSGSRKKNPDCQPRVHRLFYRDSSRSNEPGTARHQHAECDNCSRPWNGMRNASYADLHRCIRVALIGRWGILSVIEIFHQLRANSQFPYCQRSGHNRFPLVSRKSWKNGSG